MSTPKAQPHIGSGPCTVLFNRALAGSYRHLAVAAGAAALSAEPGQFFQLLCPGQGAARHILRRPMSLYHLDRAHGRVEFLFKVVGTGTQGLARLQPGDGLDLVGPLGRGFHLRPDWRHIVLLGRGAGMATLAPLAEAALARGMAVTAVLSAAQASLAVAADHLRAAGAEVTVVTDADDSAAPASVEQKLRSLHHDRGIDLIATCGSARLLRLVQHLALHSGIAAQVALEQPMACGLGMCFCCVRPFRVDGRTEYLRVCYEGPVFDAKEAIA